MNKPSRQLWIWVLMLLVAVTYGCQSESPTAPRPGGGTGGGGTTPPPTGASVTVTVSNPEPLILSTTQITATVTVDGQPAPNGTAVEFSTDLGTFSDTNSSTTIRTTTGGVASAILSSPTAGTATITVRVNNVSKTTTVRFRLETPTPGGGSTTPTITSITPATGSPAGSQQVVIRGTNFKAPLRVLFGTKDATILSASETQLVVLTPSINLGGTQQSQDVIVTVITQAGTASEALATAPSPFSYRNEILTPLVYTVSPASGPVEGNTRITIFGEGFQYPTRVFFGTAGGAGSPLTNQVELEVISVTFSQIIAVTPPALGLGVDLQSSNGQVTMRVLNVGTNKDAVLPLAFRYGPSINITAISATGGSVFGGDHVTIYGWGFDDPVAVSIAGIPATTQRVSGTEIVAVTGAPEISNCAVTGGGTGPVIVTNIEDGQTATSKTTFTYRLNTPTITTVVPPDAQPGATVQIGVLNPGVGPVRVRVGTQIVTANPGAGNTATSGTFTFVVPNITFQTEACTTTNGIAGTRQIPTIVDLTFQNTTTGCSQTLQGGLTVDPTAAGATCVAPPDEVPQPPALTFGGATTVFAPATCIGPKQFFIFNGGGSPLTVTGFTSSDPVQFQVTPPAVPFTLAPGATSAAVNVSFCPTAAGVVNGSIAVSSNDPAPTPVTVTGTTITGP